MKVADLFAAQFAKSYFCKLWVRIVHLRPEVLALHIEAFASRSRSTVFANRRRRFPRLSCRVGATSVGLVNRCDSFGVSIRACGRYSEFPMPLGHGVKNVSGQDNFAAPSRHANTTSRV